MRSVLAAGRVKEARQVSMSGRSRLMIAVSAALLAAAYVLPVWRIDLIAPQYPEGLGMLIRIDTIVGIKPADLANINGLNHYIGMKAIRPEEIPVLRVMPVALGILVGMGLAVAAFGRRWAAWTWLGLIAAGGAGALFEFWRWSYDYGHNLAADAIIKIPDMTYQPPLIGSKQLLNFTATSWPAAGGWLAVAAFVLALAALFPFRRRLAAIVEQPSARAGALAATVLFAISAIAAMPTAAEAQLRTVTVSPAGPVRTLSAALALVAPGGRVVIKPGHYIARSVTVGKPVTIVGEGFPVLDAENKGEILRITSPDVTVTGLRFTGVGSSYTHDWAAVRAVQATRCRISGNVMDNVFFGVYLEKSDDCIIAGNTLRGSGKTETTSGNGIHLWASRRARIERNSISGFRDGIYFEFVHDTQVANNVSERNLRYGLHFMYSNDCEYDANIFSQNGSGVAVMFSKRVHMTANRFERNWGGAAYGLLLKEISDSRLDRNIFRANTIGLFADGADRIQATGNVFESNGWAIKVEGSTQDGRFTSNSFVRNTFDVSTNSQRPSTTFEGNFWDAYRGYDLDRDGTGDVPHPPVRLFSVIVERSPQAIVLLRSALVTLLDAAERAMPSLTPLLFVDPKPSMRRVA